VLIAAIQVNVWVAVAGGVVGIIGAIVGYTKFVAQAPLEAKTAQLEGELKRKEEELERRDKEITELKDAYNTALQDFMSLKSGRSAALIKREIDNELALARTALRATESSVLVPGPLPYSKTFVFLSIYGQAAPRLRKTKPPIDQGIAGKVFREGHFHNSKDPYREREFLAAVDKKGEHVTRTMVTAPISYQGKTIGVVQFLNKENGQNFGVDDERIAVQAAGNIAPRAVEFLRDPGNFDVLGLSTDSGREATILYCDLTASSSMFHIMDPGSVIDAINEYLERQAEIAFQHGGTVDKYLGDGAMFAFNARRSSPDRDHAATAVEAALMMQEDFKNLRRGWLETGMQVDPVRNRIGIALGSVLMPVMGHPQFQQVTVFGDTVGRAARLCEVAPRDRDIVVIDSALERRVRERFLVQPLQQAPLKNLGEVSLSLFEVIEATRPTPAWQG
jgi:class 3 adenylate cyclase